MYVCGTGSSWLLHSKQQRDLTSEMRSCSCSTTSSWLPTLAGLRCPALFGPINRNLTFLFFAGSCPVSSSVVERKVIACRIHSMYHMNSFSQFVFMRRYAGKGTGAARSGQRVLISSAAEFKRSSRLHSVQFVDRKTLQQFLK